jgi:hypothetical protein
MEYLYGEFSDSQIELNAEIMHSEIHKLLLHKDKRIEEIIFDSEDDFLRYFNNLLYRYGGFNELLGEPVYMVSLMSTLQAAYDEARNKPFRYSVFRRLILDSHGYITQMFEEVDKNA